VRRVQGALELGREGSGLEPHGGVGGIAGHGADHDPSGLMRERGGLSHCNNSGLIGI
jgi:hypothetical protein